MGNFRLDRINEEVRRELAQIFQNEMRDPRIGFVSILKVQAAPDMKTAKVFVSHLNGKEDLQASMAALKSASGYLRSELSRRLNTRTVPELIFIADDSIEYGMKIDRLLHKISNEDEKND